ncbi:MAG: hypothetical protein P4L36_18375 [Holophaga sp.]|nr:hypothetical protein [Holophaga sp.]
MRACENDQFEIKELRFSDGDSVFKVTTSIPGQLADKTVEINLADVDIYTKRTAIKSGKDDYTYAYSLIATNRGRANGIKRNMTRVTGSEVLLRQILNGRQVKALEMAFIRLTDLVAGRRPLFVPAVDPP